jgi:biopolymer transport protein TolQ
MIASSGPVAKTVLVVLLGFSFLSWSVMIERYRLYRKALRESREFLDAMEQSRNLADLRDRCDRFAGSPLVPIFKAGFRELTSQALVSDERRFKNPPAPGDVPTQRRLEKIQRVLDRASLAENERLEAFLPVLATTGSVTPFVGLFGTVWGIMNAFRGLANVSQATLAHVAPGIAEALIATAIGLFAAIPAVVAYNRYTHDVDRLSVRFETFIEEFSNILQRQG